MKWGVIVRTDDSGEWYSNGQKFETKEEANQYGRDLYHRWSAVKEWNVVKVPKERRHCQPIYQSALDNEGRAYHQQLAKA
jgi:hypothetical protein